MRRAPAFLIILFLAPVAAAQGTKADYERANTVRQWTANKVVRAKVETNWTPDGNVFWYRNDLPGGKKEFVLVDAEKGTREIVTEDKLPKDTKPLSTPPKKKFGKGDESPEWREEEGEAEEFFVAQPPRGGNSASPDGKWRAVIKDYNVYLRDAKTEDERQGSKDGEAGDAYGRVFWSPDSNRLVAIKTKAGGDRKVTLVESSPRDQLQPKVSTYDYLKPGDTIPLAKPHLFDV